MQKTRTQLREGIAKGKLYLERTDLTEQEREAAERKIDRYYLELALLPEDEPLIPDDPFDLEPDTTPVPEQPAVDDPSITYRQMIRGILQPIKEGAKRRGAV